MFIKRFFIKILASFLRGTGWLADFFAKRVNGFPGWGEKIIKAVFFPFYKIGYFVKSKIVMVFAPAKSKVFYFLNKTYLAYIVICLLGGMVVVDNIRAEELSVEDFGAKTLAYELITKEEYEELTIEYGIKEKKASVLSYLDKDSVMPSSNLAGQAVIQDEEQAIASELSTVTEGGTALVKPNILKPVEERELNVVVDPGSQRTEIIKYTVETGDVIGTIAKKFGVSLETILWQNNLTPNSIIKPGDELEILPVTGVVHDVKSGESILGLANKYDVASAEIERINDLSSGQGLKIGQELIIPGGRKVSTYVARSTSTPSISNISKLFIPPETPVTTSGFLWPTSVRRITQYYSWRHKGLDIAGPVGTPLYASDDGTVVYSGWTNGYGYNVVIDHGNGYRTLYAHASKLYVSKGDAVVKGQTIAGMGSTGWSTGPHIHFEVMVGGVKQNPLSYIK